MDFQKIGKKSGEPYDILDDKIAEYVAHKRECIQAGCKKWHQGIYRETDGRERIRADS